MILTLNYFLRFKVQRKFHILNNRTELISALNKHVDTLSKMDSIEYNQNEKIYQGSIAESYFEAKLKYVPGDLSTLSAGIIRGDFRSVGNNTELELKMKTSKGQAQNTSLFLMFPIIIMLVAFFKPINDNINGYVFLICTLIMITYHILNRLSEFYGMRKFLKLLKLEMNEMLN